MIRYFARICSFVLIGLTMLSAQISPGELSEAHKDLEGIGNCTSCHTIGKSLSNDNCFACHGEIQSRIRQKRGYHFGVREQQCVACHKEHHGRTFDLVRFDKAQFRHEETGYTLEGKHTQIACEQCHRKGNLADADVKKYSDVRKSKTFLGLGKECLSCHRDEHRGQFKGTCVQCHTLNAWKPAPQFDHQRTRFPLTGIHTTIACEKCHPRSFAGNRAVRFTGLAFGSCRSCHTDPHAGRFKQECSRCHVTESWYAVRSGSFNHSTTKFPLTGKHSNLKCEQCHSKDPKRRNVTGETGFKITRFQQCSHCHADAHARQFLSRSDKGECESCHTVNGFTPARFDAADHAKTRLPLTGAHRAVACGECHRDVFAEAKSKKRFHWSGTIQCLLCHKDVHAGQFDAKMKNGCETCHNTETWQRISFSHDKTNFPLREGHALLQCAQCHQIKNGVTTYVGTGTACESCHEDRHAGQFASSAGTRCERCHSEKKWKLIIFDHNTQSRFALTGKHLAVECMKCHKETVFNKKRTIKYKPLEAACIDCHPA